MLAPALLEALPEAQRRRVRGQRGCADRLAEEGGDALRPGLLERGLVVLSTQPTRDGMAGDQSLFAPPFTTTDAELAEMVSRFADAVGAVAAEVEL